VTADSQYALQHYGEAEKAYANLLEVVPASDPQHQAAETRRSGSIYKAADAARDSGDLRAAAQGYERLGQSATDESVRSKADYDAAATYIKMQDWADAERMLESYPVRHPGNDLIPDADKKLAIVYQKDGKLGLAAAAYQRISQRTTETADARQDSAWLACQLFDQAGMKPQAMQAYQSYLTQYPQPFDRAMDVRQWFAEYYKSANNNQQYDAWLHNIVAADEAAGPARTEKSKAMSARATLQFGREQVAVADGIPLTLPIKKSLPRKSAAEEGSDADCHRYLDAGRQCGVRRCDHGGDFPARGGVSSFQSQPAELGKAEKPQPRRAGTIWHFARRASRAL
jgi:hypothetical protein